MNNNSVLLARNISNINYSECTLDNGLHVILHRDTSNPLVSVNIWYHVGSKDEDPGKTGFAHLFEHMMFQGSKNITKAEHFKYIQQAGGIVNGSTSQDRTNYYESVPSNQLELVLWLESDRMGYLNVNRENFDNQRDVVKEEKRQNYDNVPYGSKWSNLFNYAFKHEPYEWVPIGSMKDLDNATLDDAIDFYKRYYSPSNAVITVSGDIENYAALELVKKYFGNIGPGHNGKKKFADLKYSFGEVKEIIYDSVQVPGIYIAYKIPGLLSDESPAVDLLTTILGESRSSRLYSKIVYEKKLAKSSSAFVWDNELGGLLIISAMGYVDSDPDEIVKNITELVEKLKSETVSDEELDKAKNKLESSMVETIQTNIGKADMLNYFWTYFKNTNLINTLISKYDSITKQDILKAANKYLKSDNRVVLQYLSQSKK
jgi:zinc protease